MKAIKIAAGVTGIIVILLTVILVTNLHTAKLLLGNWFSPKVQLEEDAEWKAGKSYENVQYSDVSKTDYLHLYVPESDKPLPLYIMVHGGGFFYNDLESRQAQLFYRYVREQGYAVATVNYRLGEEARYPAAIADVKAAIRFLRANADEYGLDSDKFAIAGESAGGYLACMAAVTTDEEFMDVSFIGEEELAETVSAKVQAVVDFYGCIEFFTFEEEFYELKVPRLVRSIANRWLSDITKGTGASSIEEVWIGKNLSDMTREERESYTVPYYAKKNLNKDTDLKVVILHGNADLTVPYLQSSHFYDTMKSLIGEEKVTYRLLENYGHAADGFYSDETLSWMLDEVALTG